MESTHHVTWKGRHQRAVFIRDLPFPYLGGGGWLVVIIKRSIINFTWNVP